MGAQLSVAQLSVVGMEPDDKLDFGTFWLVWAGKQIKRKHALLQWGYMTADQQVAAIEGALVWRPVWTREDWRFLPDPVTWLQGERWEDVPPRTAKTQAQVEFAPEADRPRGTLTQFAKDAIAKIAAMQRGSKNG